MSLFSHRERDVIRRSRARCIALRTTHVHFKLSLMMGKVRMRLPVAAKIALQTAGAAAGRAGSPKPVGGSVDLTK